MQSAVREEGEAFRQFSEDHILYEGRFLWGMYEMPSMIIWVDIKDCDALVIEQLVDDTAQVRTLVLDEEEINIVQSRLIYALAVDTNEQQAHHVKNIALAVTNMQKAMLGQRSITDLLPLPLDTGFVIRDIIHDIIASHDARASA